MPLELEFAETVNCSAGVLGTKLRPFEPTLQPQGVWGSVFVKFIFSCVFLCLWICG